MSLSKTLAREDYRVAWVCALPVEFSAAEDMLDEIHGSPLPPIENDTNRYGQIKDHNIVITCLPEYGTISAALAGSQLLHTFTGIRLCLLVGLGGGVPSQAADVRLGDIVVSKPTGSHGGVIQYDFGKQKPKGFSRVGTLNKPNPALLKAIARLEANQRRDGDSTNREISDTIARLYPGKPEFDRTKLVDELYQADYIHEGKEGSGCEHCDKTKLVSRPSRRSLVPRVHYGLIGSGNRVMRNGTERDAIANTQGILCFEMEAAGLMDTLNCLVVRGICDYSDSHKTKDWQPYASAMAAACASQILSILTSGGPTSQNGRPQDGRVAPMIFFTATVHPFNYFNNLPQSNSGILNQPQSQGGEGTPLITGTSTKRLSSVPRFFVPRYACRNQNVHQIRQVLQDGKALGNFFVCIVQGLGRIGKSDTALEYAHRYGDEFDVVFWISADDRNLREDWQRLWRGLRDRYGEARYQSASECLENIDASWLIIFDNVECMQEIESILPRACANHGTILITTRSEAARMPSLKRAEQYVRIRPLTDGVGGDLFHHALEHYSRIYNRMREPKSQRLMQGISRALGGNPGILNEAALAVAKQETSLDQLLDPLNTLRTTCFLTERTLGLSELLQTQDKWAALLGVLSLFGNVPVEAWLLAEYFRRPSERSRDFMIQPRDTIDYKTVNTLKSLDILTQEQTYPLHLNQAVRYELLRLMSSQPEQYLDSFNIAFETIRQKLEPQGPDSLSYQQGCEPSALKSSLLEYLCGLWKTRQVIRARDKNNYWELLYDASFHLWNAHSNLEQAVKFSEMALESLSLSDLETPQKDEFQSYVHILLGRLYVEIGFSRRASACDHLRKGLRLRQDINSHTDPNLFTRGHTIQLCTCQIDMATYYLDIWRVSDAFKLYENSLTVYDKWDDSQRLPFDWARICYGIAFCHILQGRPDEGETWGRAAARAICSRGPSIFTATYDYLLACVLAQNGRTEEAIALHRNALDARIRLYGQKSHLAAMSHYAVGSLEAEMGQLAAAEASMRRALDGDFWQPEEAKMRAELHLSIVKLEIECGSNKARDSELGKQLFDLDKRHGSFDGRFVRKMDIRPSSA